jgi:hypothetical protein
MEGKAMANEVTIKYGDDTLSLKKSENLVAIKLKPGTEARTLKSVAPQFSKSENMQAELGGFCLVNTKDVPGADADESLDMLRANGGVDVGTHVYETSDDGVPFVPTGQLYVECKASAQKDKIQELFNEHSLEIVEVRGEREFIVQVTRDSENPVKTAASLQKSPLIDVAEPDLATPGAI